MAATRIFWPSLQENLTLPTTFYFADGRKSKPSAKNLFADD
jgi:hypothetical protein